MSVSLSARGAAFKGPPTIGVHTLQRPDKPSRVYLAAFGEACRLLFREGASVARRGHWDTATLIAELAAEVGTGVAHSTHDVVGPAVVDAVRSVVHLIHEAQAAGGEEW